MNFGSLNPFSGGGGLPGLPSLPGLPNFGGGGGFLGLPGFPGMGGQQQGGAGDLGGTMQTSPYSDPNSGVGSPTDIQGLLSMLMQGSQGMGGGQQSYIGGQGLI